VSDNNRSQLALAVEDFRRLRRRASLERLLAGLTGGQADLLNFDEVRKKLRATAVSERQLREIPLDAIVGSVGRYQDFSRTFLPRTDADAERWARVMLASDSLTGLPPIEVYQIGEVYFVVDGNHRVSVARQNGAKTIPAYVIPFRARVPLTPGARPRDLLLGAEQTAFLEATRLDEMRPDVDLTLTELGQYHLLREHIDVHGFSMELERGTPVTLEEAATDWLDRVYTPAVALMRDRGLLHEFPGRTEADLFLWVAEHRVELEGRLGWEITTEQATTDLVGRKGAIESAGEQVLDRLIPDELTPPPPPGLWRRDRLEPGDAWLFDEILVPVSGEPAGWEAVEQALAIARVEGARLYGLHVLRDGAQRQSAAAEAVRTEFARRCAEAGVNGRLALEVGPVARTIRERSRWADLVVLQISHPPGPGPLARLKSGLHSLIRTVARPVLTVPRATGALRRILLAYDASPRAEEALVLAAYLTVRWTVPLAVVTVADPRQPSLESARISVQDALERRGVTAEFITTAGAPGPAILAAAERTASDLIVIGGHGQNPVSDLLLGSAVEEVLRAGRLPTLICP
jgi:nucleotide-binding universal stress UspA family protein